MSPLHLTSSRLEPLRKLGSWWTTTGLGTDFVRFLVVSFFFTLGMYIFYFLYSLYLLDIGFKENFIGMLTSAMTLGGVAGTLPAGVLTQRLGVRKALLICITLVSAISVVRSLVASPASLIVLAFLAGFVNVIWAVALPPAIAQLTTDKNRPFGFSVTFFCGIAVGILGARLGGELPGWLTHLNLRLKPASAKELTMLLAAGIIALAILPAFRLQFAAKPAREKKIYSLSPFLKRFLAAMAVWGLAIGAILPFFNVYFSRYLQMSLRQIGIVDSVSRFPQLIALLAAPAIFRKFGLLKGIVVAQVATAMTLGALAAVTNKSAAAMVYMGYVTFQWASEPGLYSLLMDRAPATERSGASALNFFVLNSVQAVAAAIAGISLVRFGYPAVLGVAAGLALLSAGLFQFLLDGYQLRSPETAPSNSYGD